MAKKPSIDFLDTRTPEQKAVNQQLAGWIQQYLPTYQPGQPYTGTYTAPASTYETQGLGYLQNFMNNPDQTPLLGQAQDEISKTLTGNYDPSTSPFYKATRDAAGIEQQDAQNALNAQTGSRGKYFSSEALNENQQLRTRTTNYLQGILGSMAQQERQNRLNVIPQALAVNQAATNAPLAKVAASQTYGALPRLLQQNDLEAQYAEFKRQQTEKEQLPGLAEGFKTTNLQTVANNPAPGFDWGSFLGSVAGPAASAGIGAFTGPAAGAASGISPALLESLVAA